MREGSLHLDAGLVEQRYELTQVPATNSGLTTLDRFWLHFPPPHYATLMRATLATLADTYPRRQIRVGFHSEACQLPVHLVPAVQV
jgi:hypothetical protein